LGFTAVQTLLLAAAIVAAFAFMPTAIRVGVAFMHFATRVGAAFQLTAAVKCNL